MNNFQQNIKAAAKHLSRVNELPAGQGYSVTFTLGDSRKIHIKLFKYATRFELHLEQLTRAYPPVMGLSISRLFEIASLSLLDNDRGFQIFLDYLAKEFN